MMAVKHPEHAAMERQERESWPLGWLHAGLPLAGAALVVAALVLTPGAARATTYKWVDDQGVVHYTDKMPPEAINKGSVELNKSGVQVKKNEPAPTPAQRRAMEAEEERQKQLARQQEIVARRDRALVQSYTNEAEIDLARDRSLRTVDSALKSARAYSEQLTKRKTELDTQKATFGDKPVPAALERELQGIDGELARQNELIAQKQGEWAKVAAKYDADKLRWQELTVIHEAEAAAPAKAAPHPASTMTPTGETKK